MNQFTPSSDVIDLIDTFKTKQRILILKWIYTVKLRLSKLSTNFNIMNLYNLHRHRLKY